MAAFSIVKRLERCEKIGRAEQGDALLCAENYQVIKTKEFFITANPIKFKIKEPSSSHHIKLRGSNEEIKSAPVRRLQNQLQVAQAGCCSPLPPCTRLQAQQISLHKQVDSHAPSSPLPPWDYDSQQNLDELVMRLHSLHIHSEEDLPLPMRKTALQEHMYTDTSSQATPFSLHPSDIGQGKENVSRGASPWKLQESGSKEREEEMSCAPEASPNLQQTLNQRKDESSATGVGKEQRGGGEDKRGEARFPWKLQITEGQEMKAGDHVLLDEVKKMECECCGIEEEYTAGYEERVRARLRGHWLCGLCEEAVGEERNRVGRSLQAALEAHMKPCRCFSHRARSKASPPPSDVALPHAVCRLLCRHLSTPAARHPSSAICLSRSSSFLNS